MANLVVVPADGIRVNNAAPETGIPEIPFLQKRVKGKELPSRCALEDLCKLVEPVRHAHRPHHVNMVFVKTHFLYDNSLLFRHLIEKLPALIAERCPCKDAMAVLNLESRVHFQPCKTRATSNKLHIFPPGSL